MEHVSVQYHETLLLPVSFKRRALETRASKAQRLDREFCATHPGVVGPFERRLLGFGSVRGLVFGHWGEASPRVTEL